MKLLDDVGNLIILFILSIIPIVDLIVLGYGAWMLKEGNTIDKPPRIMNYGELFIEGLKIIIVGIIYAIIPALIGYVIALMYGAPFILSHYLPGWGPWLSTSLFLLPAIGIAGLIGIIFAIFAVMGIIYMIKSGEFSKAFAIREILKLIEEIGWGEYLVWLIILYVIGSILAWISSSLYIIGAILGVFYIVFAARSAHNIYPERMASPSEISM